MGDLSQTNVKHGETYENIVKNVKIEESVILHCCRQPLVYGCAKYEVDPSMERCITMPYINVLLL